jgi:hypothetical protein
MTIRCGGAPRIALAAGELAVGWEGAALAVATVNSNARSATTAGSALRSNLFTFGPLWSGQVVRSP